MSDNAWFSQMYQRARRYPTRWIVTADTADSAATPVFIAERVRFEGWFVVCTYSLDGAVHVLPVMYDSEDAVLNGIRVLVAESYASTVPESQTFRAVCFTLDSIREVVPS